MPFGDCRRKRKPSHKPNARTSVDSDKSETSHSDSAAPVLRERNTKGPKSKNVKPLVKKADKSGDPKLQSRGSEAVNEPHSAAPDSVGSKTVVPDQTSSSIVPPEGLHKSLKHTQNNVQWQKKAAPENKQIVEKVKPVNKGITNTIHVHVPKKILEICL